MAYKHWDGERAINNARAVDEFIKVRLDTSVLMALPFSVKEIFGDKAMPTFGGQTVGLPANCQTKGLVVRA